MGFSIFYIKIVFLLLFLSTRFDKSHQRTFLYSSGAGSYRSPIPTYQSPDIPTCLLQVLWECSHGAASQSGPSALPHTMDLRSPIAPLRRCRCFQLSKWTNWTLEEMQLIKLHNRWDAIHRISKVLRSSNDFYVGSCIVVGCNIVACLMVLGQLKFFWWDSLHHSLYPGIIWVTDLIMILQI